jgi:hypothetical protein
MKRQNPLELVTALLLVAVFAACASDSQEVYYLQDVPDKAVNLWLYSNNKFKWSYVDCDIGYVGCGVVTTTSTGYIFQTECRGTWTSWYSAEQKTPFPYSAKDVTGTWTDNGELRVTGVNYDDISFDQTWPPGGVCSVCGGENVECDPSPWDEYCCY